MRFVVTRFIRDEANEPVPVLEETGYQTLNLGQMITTMTQKYGMTKTVITRVDDQNNRFSFFVADEEEFANTVFEVSVDV